VLTSDAQDDDRFSGGQSVVRTGVREAICVPMQGRYGTVGVIYVDTSVPLGDAVEAGQRKFTDEHLRLLVAIGHQAALAVEDTTYYSAMVQSERLAAIGQTIATLSHHIKNILQGIRGGSYLVDMGLKDDDLAVLRKGWDIVSRNQNKISSLVMDMLSFSKEREPDPVPSDLVAVISDIVETVQQRATELNATITWVPPTDLPRLLFDPEAMSRAILNVVTNALDAVEQRETAAVVIGVGAAFERWHFAGFSKSQEARKARFAKWTVLERLSHALPMSSVRRHLLVKDLKVFLRDVSQWSQLLLLVALMLVYLYNFRVLDLDRIPYMSGVLKNAYAFLNLAMAGFVMATVAVRFVFPAVSAEGAAFWIIRTAPISMKDFLWSKFWTGLVPVLLLTECLIVAGNELLGVDPFLKRVSAVAIVFMAFALVAGSYGGVAFMIVAVLFILVIIVLVGWPSSMYLLSQVRERPLTDMQQVTIALCFALAVAISIATWLLGMRSDVRALQAMDRSPG